jgi:hypothetical protein
MGDVAFTADDAAKGRRRWFAMWDRNTLSDTSLRETPSFFVQQKLVFSTSSAASPGIAVVFSLSEDRVSATGVAMITAQYDERMLSRQSLRFEQQGASIASGVVVRATHLRGGSL